MAAAYGKSKTAQTPGGLIMLDEAFEKMDAQNVRATAEYLNALGLQMILAGPEADQPKMSSFLDIYYDMARHGSDQIQLTKNIVLDEARSFCAATTTCSIPSFSRRRWRDWSAGLPMLADAVLAGLLARAEKLALSSGRTAKEKISELDAYWALSLKDRDAFHERMRKAEREGGIHVAWSKQGGEDRTADLISVKNVPALASFLGTTTRTDVLSTASTLLAPWAAHPRVRQSSRDGTAARKSAIGRRIGERLRRCPHRPGHLGPLAR